MKNRAILLMVITIATLITGCAASSTSPDGVNCKPLPMEDRNPDCVGGR
ncbi:hypothetical protein [Polynucleobacter sp. UK-Kesae-W10]|nr:hypothetical protein [Polynucleobacter sp. UK-Kesae-W10]MBU3576584.1 hypothetical protein [Polynucleobacter sp. UK-Kesae-W10]